MTAVVKRDSGAVFDAFRKRISGEVYSEPDSSFHKDLIDALLPQFAESHLKEMRDAKILDVGCGQGYACLKFKELGFENVTGITLSDEDVAASKERGIDCHKMDFSFLEFADDVFDVLWVRHALEHSPFPYLTLLEFNRVLRNGGKLYIEMPMPDTPRILEHWTNHYSVMGEKMWASLFFRSGFDVKVSTSASIQLTDPKVNQGQPFEETYLIFILEKTENQTLNI